MSRLAIVTDSTSDIPADYLARHSIHVVPNIVVIDSIEYLDGVDLSRPEFYAALPTMKAFPTTATASSGTYEELYRKLLQSGAEQILSIHASSLLSGIFNAASLAAQPFGERVRVVDSQYISLGLGFQVLAAAEAARSQPMEAILPLLDDLRARVRVVAMLDTLEYIRRSGRVSWARARLGELLRIKPFVEVKQGTVHSLGETRTRRKGIQHLLEMLQGQGALERLAILHTSAEADAEQFLADLDPHLATTPIIVHVTTVIGAHVGPNGLGFAAVLA